MSESKVGEPFVVNLEALELLNPNSVGPVYANNANLAIAPWDVRFIFSEIVTTSKPGEVANELKAHVVMTPAHAKAMINALVQTINAYEKQFGEIKMPDMPRAAS